MSKREKISEERRKLIQENGQRDIQIAELHSFFPDRVNID